MRAVFSRIGESYRMKYVDLPICDEHLECVIVSGSLQEFASSRHVSKRGRDALNRFAELLDPVHGIDAEWVWLELLHPLKTSSSEGVTDLVKEKIDRPELYIVVRHFVDLTLTGMSSLTLLASELLPLAASHDSVELFYVNRIHKRVVFTVYLPRGRKNPFNKLLRNTEEELGIKYSVK